MALDISKIDAFQPEKTKNRKDGALNADAIELALRRPDWSGSTIGTFLRGNGFPDCKDAYVAGIVSTARATFDVAERLLLDSETVLGGFRYAMTRKPLIAAVPEKPADKPATGTDGKPVK